MNGRLQPVFYKCELCVVCATIATAREMCHLRGTGGADYLSTRQPVAPPPPTRLRRVYVWHQHRQMGPIVKHDFVLSIA